MKPIYLITVHGPLNIMAPGPLNITVPTLTHDTKMYNFSSRSNVLQKDLNSLQQWSDCGNCNLI